MNREKQLLAQELLVNVGDIEKALDILADHKVLTYVLLGLQDVAFEKQNADAAFFEGAYAFGNLLDSLPTALKAATRK